MIKVIVENLTIEGTPFEGSEPADFLILSQDENYIVSEPIEYDFVASVAAGDVIIRGGADVTIKGQCGKCLKECETLLEHDDICCYFEKPGQGELDISEQFREEISINLPADITCSDNCKGLCSKCGQDLNEKECQCQDSVDDECEEENIWGKLDDLEIDN